jgi:hypothetical protein
VTLVLKGLLGLLDHKELPVLKGYKVSLVHKEARELPEYKELLELRVP